MIKKILIIAILFYGGIVSAQTPNLKIYFLNGIANSQIDAKKSATALTNVLSSLTGNIKVESIYNPTGKNSGLSVNGVCLAFDPSTQTLVTLPSVANGIADVALPWSIKLLRSVVDVCIVSDLGELRDSKLNEENYFSLYSSRFVVGNNSQTYDNLNQLSASQFVAEYFSKEQQSVQAVAKQTARQVKNSIAAGNKVLLVAHSQGNLVANWAWVLLVSQLSTADLKKLRILNIANTSLLSPHSANITHAADKEIFGNLPRLGRLPLRRSALCQPVDLRNGASTCDFLVATPTYSITAAANQSLPDTHNFVAAYLSGNTITSELTGEQTTFANAMYATVQRLLAGMSDALIAPGNTAPISKILSNGTSISLGREFNFSSTSTDEDGQIVNYAWNLGDGTTKAGAQIKEVIHSYGAVGQYTVTLTVTDNQGATSKSVVQVFVTAEPQPDLVPGLVTASPANIQPGGSLNVSWRVTNSGNGNAAVSTTGIRLLSATTSGNGTSANNLVNVPTGALAAGGVANQSQLITIPAGTAPGSYVVVVTVDNVATTTLGQSNVTNDFALSAAFTVGATPPLTPPPIVGGIAAPTGLTPQGTILPMNGVISSGVDLNWNYVASALYYKWEISGSRLQSPLAGNTLVNRSGILDLGPNSTFTFRVSACTGAPEICSSYATANFTTPYVPGPGSPNGLAPGNANLQAAPTIYGSSVSFRWNAVPGAPYYKFQLNREGFGFGAGSYELGYVASGLLPGLYSWRVAACLDPQSVVCGPFSTDTFLTLQSSAPTASYFLTSGSQDLFDQRGSSSGLPSGNAYAPNIGIFGSGLDSASQIKWSWNGATTGNTTWTKSPAGTWMNEIGASKSVATISTTELRVTPTLITANDTWRGVLNWTVTVCKISGVCDSLNFSVLR